MQLALLQRHGLDVPDLFSAISSWPSPNFSPSALCRACCWLGTVAWRSCLRAPLPLLGSPKSSGLLVTGLHEANYQELRCVCGWGERGVGVGSRSTCRVRRKGSEMLVPWQDFAVLFSFRQVIPTPGPQFPHLLNGCKQLGYMVPGAPCIWTLMLLPASISTLLWTLPAPCYDHSWWVHHSPAANTASKRATG